MKYAWFFFIYIFGILGAAEKGFDVNIHVEDAQISINQLLQVNLDLTFPIGYEVDIEALQENINRSSNFYEHPFSVASINVKPIQTVSDQQASQQINMDLQPLQIGKVWLAFYDIVFLPTDKKNKQESIVGGIYPIEVLPMQITSQDEGHLAPLLTFAKTLPAEFDSVNLELLESPKALADQERIDQEQMKSKSFPWIPLLAILLICLIFLIFLKGSQMKATLTPEQLTLLAKKEALDQLDQLKHQNLPAKGFFEDFYVQLTNPVRSYIEKKYHLPVSTRTTSEFLSETAQSTIIPSETRKTLGQFLYQADKVKFGLYKPSPEECDQAEKLAIQFIQQDKP